MKTSKVCLILVQRRLYEIVQIEYYGLFWICKKNDSLNNFLTKDTSFYKKDLKGKHEIQWLIRIRANVLES